MEVSRKRPVSSETHDKSKSIKIFSAEDFRMELQGNTKLLALQGFLHAVKVPSKQDCILSYLEKGGSPLEILQLMESDPQLSPLPVYEVVNEILLGIGAKYPKYYSRADESCRYLLNNQVTLVNKMLGLGSSSVERITILRLLTTIVTFSAVLAKDILLHVNFNPTNLELLTKVRLGKVEVRDTFIHFIVSFLVDGNFAPLAVLLERKGLLTSIVNGLIFDRADTVVLVLTTLKSHILENILVSKTMKMKVFNTAVIRDFVNLYNWKGPRAIPDPKKKNQEIVTVDEIIKTKVNKALHAFLLVLCTSHRFGVIFKDATLGLGKKNQNTLIFTVLESLQRPWEHSYASELVTKICGACPDLTKPIWTNITGYLEPRSTAKWLSAMKFSEKLLDELHPDNLGTFLKDSNTQQINFIITTKIMPKVILKTIILDESYENSAVKNQVLMLLLKMCTVVEKYLEKAKSCVNVEVELVKTSVASHMYKHFPKSEFILKNWDQISNDVDNFPQVTIADNVKVAVNLLEYYRIFAPQLLESLHINFDIDEFLAKLENAEGGDQVQMGCLQIKAAKFFLSFDPSLFNTKSNLFTYIVSFSLKFYHETRDLNALTLIHNLLKNSAVFEGFEMEIDMWIDGILNLKKYNENVASFLTNIIKLADENIVKYNAQLSNFKSANFSPLILCVRDNSNEIEMDKSLKLYLSFVIVGLFHLQIDLNPFKALLEQLTFLPVELVNYIESWSNMGEITLSKCKGRLMEHLSNFSSDFLENNLDIGSLDFTLYPNSKLNLLQAAIFYINNLIKNRTIKDNHRENCLKFVDLIIASDDRCLKTVLDNAVLLEYFTILDCEDFCTKFVMEILRKCERSKTATYCVNFREKAVAVLSKVFKKPHKYQNVKIAVEVVQVLELDYSQCCDLVKKFLSDSENRGFYYVITHCLDRIAFLAKINADLQPLSDDSIKSLSSFFVELLKTNTNLSNFSSSLLGYLRIFPHSALAVENVLFENLLLMNEFHKDNALLCEFLLEKNPALIQIFENHFDEMCSKTGCLLQLLRVFIEQKREDLLKNIFNNLESHIIKALEKPHKANKHLKSHYKTIGYLIDHFMTPPDSFGQQIAKFETTELFHVYLLKRVFDKVKKTEKIAGNMIMTYIHLVNNLMKQKNASKPISDFAEISCIFHDFLQPIEQVEAKILQNDSVKTFCKFCLKFGVTEEAVLLKILTKFADLCLVEEEAKLIFDMMLSHSEFLDVVLGSSGNKTELLTLFLTICTKWPQFMERSHVAVILSAYKATRQNSDRIALSLLKLYESKADQTCFFDFKPFLWGHAAAVHYSIRSDVQKVLFRQPKMYDVLRNLHLATVEATITDPSSVDAYDLDFFLPLFSHLLSSENIVQTYHFTTTGALALTITGLRGDHSQRLAACCILSRFYFHLEAKQTGKDSILWMRFVEAVCKGTAVVEDFRLNNFAGIYLARTALILTNPGDVMYVPVSRYLAAKDSLNFQTIPELYTLLHSPDVHCREHQHFVLDMVKDGLKTEKDLGIFLHAMGFKLISELLSSSISQIETKNKILEIIQACLIINPGKICEATGLLPHIVGIFMEMPKEDSLLRSNVSEILRKVVRHSKYPNFLNVVGLN